MTQAQYARHRGVSPVTVHHAVRSGKIKRDRDGKIDPVAADRAWKAGSHPGGHGGRRRPRAHDLAPDAGGPTFAAMRARREQAQAELAELDLAKKRGDLASIAAMREEVFELNRRTRDMLLALPDRLAPRLAGIDQVEAYRVLTDEINRVCAEIAEARPL